MGVDFVRPWSEGQHFCLISRAHASYLAVEYDRETKQGQRGSQKAFRHAALESQRNEVTCPGVGARTACTETTSRSAHQPRPTESSVA